MPLKTYTGSCHCKAVTYTANVDLSFTILCNCSICHKAGTLLAFTTEEEFTLHTGAENLQDYMFNTQAINHLFCKTCGIKSFGRKQEPDGSKVVAINIRCLDDVDIETIELTKIDGKSF
jgi:hypothetical protein